MDDYLESMAQDMDSVLEALHGALGKVRTGHATPRLLDDVQVQVASYGAVMPLIQLATVVAVDARMLTVTPWDKTTLNDCEKAIMSAGLGLNPSNDGQLIRVPVPALTAQRRQELIKQVRRISEETKVRIRQVRREYNDIFKAAEKDKELSEDELHRLQARVQEHTDTAIRTIDAAIEAKEAEVQEV